MKRTGHLFESIVERENVRRAVHKALKGKRHRQDARAWTEQLDRNIDRLMLQLNAGNFLVGRFHQFVIYDPKERLITAPCFEERVLHHAIMNVVEPHLDHWLIHDTYACRTGKGRIACLLRARKFARRHRFFLKMDVRKYFDSIPHDRLLSLWQRRIKDRRLERLLERIIHSYRGSLGRGLPIGALTSQHLANFYLGWFDRYCKEQLRIPGYVRYMDDLALWADDMGRLQEAERAAECFLAEELELTLKPWPYRNRTSHGMAFLGCRVFDTHLVLNRRSRVRFRRKLKKLETAWQNHLISETELQTRATSLLAFTRTTGISSWRFRRRVLQG